MPLGIAATGYVALWHGDERGTSVEIASNAGTCSPDGVLCAAHCRHGVLIPPGRGGQCMRGCRVAEAFA